MPSDLQGIVHAHVSGKYDNLHTLDGLCTLENGTVHFAMRNDSNKTIHVKSSDIHCMFTPLQVDEDDIVHI